MDCSLVAIGINHLIPDAMTTSQMQCVYDMMDGCALKWEPNRV